jgi:hypothetical protein
MQLLSFQADFAGCFNLLDNKSIKVGQLLDGGLGWILEVFFFELASDRVLVTEDEVDLTRKIQYLLTQ